MINGRFPFHFIMIMTIFYRLHKCRCIAILFIGLPLLLTGQVQADSPSRAQVETALVFRLMKFINWPDVAPNRDRDSLILCTLGRDPLGGQLQKLQGKVVNGRQLQVVRLESEAKQDTDCQVFYIERPSRDKIRAVSRKNVLTISNVKGFARRGGMVEMSQKRSRINISINLNQVRNHDLNIDSQLLDLATIIDAEAN